VAYHPEIWQLKSRLCLVEVERPGILVLDHAESVEADGHSPEQVLRPSAVKSPLIGKGLFNPRGY
jgi:hypothetical protein